MENKFPERLKEARKAKKLTQKELAERLGITENNIGHYENGRNKPPFEIILKLCAELDVSADWLLDIQNKSSTENKAI